MARELSDKILWGVNAHNRGYVAYRDNQEKAVALAAEMGSTIYRINYTPFNEEELVYIRTVAADCRARGMKTMLVLDRLRVPVEEIERDMTYVAENLKDDFDYFQIFNEVDCWCFWGDDDKLYNENGDHTGQSEDFYNPKRKAYVMERMEKAVRIFRRLAPQAKLVTTVAGRHFPAVDWCFDAGLKFDVVAFNMYDPEGFDHAEFFGRMAARYPDSEIMLAECNMNIFKGPYTEQQQADIIEDYCKTLQAIPCIKAVILYELLDEPNRQNQKPDGWEPEGHFGLVNMTDEHTVGEPKEAYRRMQKLLGVTE